MSTELARRETHAAPVPSSYSEALKVGQALAQSGYFQDAREGAQAAAKVIAGMELGIGAMAAMTGIHVIKGKVALGATLIAALIRRSGRYDYEVLEHSDSVCRIAFTVDGRPVGESAFTLENAKAAGLLSNGTWKAYPRNMLFSRALTNGARWHCPDVFTGPVYTPDELGAQVDGGTGEIIDAPPAPPAPPVDPIADSRMQELVALAGDGKTVASVLREHGFDGRGDLVDDGKWKQAKALVAEAAATPAETPAEPTGEVISEDQRRYLEALARDLGRDHDWMSALAAEAGFASSTLITRDQFDAFKGAMAKQADAEDKATRQEAA